MGLEYNNMETALKDNVVIDYVPFDEDCLYKFYFQDGYFYKEKLAWGSTLMLVKRKNLKDLFTKNLSLEWVLGSMMPYKKVYYNIDEVVSRITNFVKNVPIANVGMTSLSLHKEIDGVFSDRLEVYKFRSITSKKIMIQFELGKGSKFGMPKTILFNIASENNVYPILSGLCEVLRKAYPDGWFSYERDIKISKPDTML